MAAPVGIDREQVIDAAVAELEKTGRVEGVALRDVANRLGIRTQSLYAHVDGADDLRRALALRGLRQLTERLTDAAIGRAGPDAIESIVLAYLRFARDQPGLYGASLRPPGDDPELRDAIATTMRPLDLVFESYGFNPEDSVHWYRIVFAAVHGFAVLDRDGLFTLPGDVDETVARLIRAITHEIETERKGRSGSPVGSGKGTRRHPPGSTGR
jgi:AcrR family transcriptional regulator